jgi:type II secretory pathway component GspD/PulD (secretin)
MMTASRLKFGFSAIVVAGVATAFLFQHQAQEKLRAENATLTQQLAQLQTGHENLSNRLATAGDSKSLSDDQLNELLKLRGEVTRLRREKNVLPEIAPLKTNNLSAVKTITILLTTWIASLPAEDLQLLGVEWVSAAQDGKTGLLTEQQFKIINQALQGASDANIISTPRAVDINGEPASISVTRAVSVSGTNVNTGTILEVTPYFSTNSSTFDLSLNAKLIQLTGDPSQPVVQTLQLTNHVFLQPGQTVVLEKKIPPGGWMDDPTNATAESRSLLMFVTPQVVNSRDFLKSQQQQSPPPNQ